MWVEEMGTEWVWILLGGGTGGKKEGEKPPGEEPGLSGSGTKSLTISGESAKNRNAGLDFWNPILESNLGRVEVPELKEEVNREAGSSK